jgi:spoIIIJ-associated protein
MKLTREQVADQAQEFLAAILLECRLEMDVEAEIAADDCVQIRLKGGDSESLLADNARLLYALNHLLNQIFFRRSLDRVSVFLDCEGYRGARDSELKLLARKAAEKVRVSGAKVVLQPMPSSERRTIHLTLAEEQGIRTQSEGSGRFRKVLILPEST